MQCLTRLNFLIYRRDKTTKAKGIPLVITYNPLFKGFIKAIYKHCHRLYVNNEVKKTSTLGPMVSFWGARKLSSYLMRVKLYPLERSVRSLICTGKRCQICMNMTESNTFPGSVDKKEYIINHNFKCSDKCIIYLLACNKCDLQYLGKTVDDFCFQCNNYKDSNRKYLRKEGYIQQHLFESFAVVSLMKLQ